MPVSDFKTFWIGVWRLPPAFAGMTAQQLSFSGNQVLLYYLIPPKLLQKDVPRYNSDATMEPFFIFVTDNNRLPGFV